MRKIPVPPGLETACFVLNRNALADVPAVLREVFPGRRPWIVADGNTFRAAGETLQRRLADAGMNPHAPHLYPAEPVLHADYAHVAPLQRELPAGAVPVAVGGGTINDIVKRMSAEAGTRYCCVPTAPSVDGYTSAGAAMTFHGLKQTLKCPAPLAIVADADVLRNAPPEMAAAGYADLFAKIPAGAEWLIADTLGIEPIRPDVWALVQPELRRRVSDPTDFDAVFAGLAATGYAMQLYRESRPASGMEHLVSHIWEMEGVEASHGFKVGIGTLASIFLHERFFALTAEELRLRMAPPKSRAEREREVAELLRRGVYGDAAPVAMEKFLEGDALAARRGAILAAWPTLQRRVKEQLIPFAEARRMLKSAGCPVEPAEIGVSQADFLHAVRAAGLIRKRYTLLDVLEECGMTAPMLEELASEFRRG